MKPKFTHGPWKVSLMRFSDGHFLIDSHTQAVAETTGQFMGKAKANAALISAAPELYEALEVCKVHIEAKLRSQDDPVLARSLVYIETALKKARGES